MSSAIARLRQAYGDIDISSGPDAKAPRLLDGLHRRQGKARAAGAPSCRELYPMHLISVVTFLGLDELLPHQTLKRRGLLSARTDAHAGRILFISHQWLGWTTADPEGAHLRALQKLLRRLISGFGGDIEADYVTQMVYGDSDRVTVAELAAALESVFPRIGLKSFVLLGAEEKRLQLEELGRIVTGIRLFNREQGKGGAGLDHVEDAVAQTVSDLREEIGRASCRERV